MTETTNPEVEVEAVETPEAEVEAPEVELDDDGNPVEPKEAEPETDEVEHEGKKYRIPKPLKGALLMQADYTRKTQELAESRKAHEDAVRQFGERQKQESEYVNQVGKVNYLNEILAQYDKLDWSALFADPNKREQYLQLQFQRQQTQEARDKEIQALNQKVSERTSTQQREAATQFDKFRSDVLSAIPEMADTSYVAKLNTYAQSIGFTPQELGQVRDVRIVKALKAAYDGSQLVQKKAVETKVKQVQDAKPLPTVTTRSSPQQLRPDTPDGDKLSNDEWLKRRNAQIAKQRGRAH